MRNVGWMVVVGAIGFGNAVASAAPADTVYRNGKVHTVDAQDSVQEALAVRGGRIVYVGTSAGAAALIGEGTRVVDLAGRVLMPGLVDAHMHPLSAGRKLVACSLDYASLTVAQFRSRIQACLDATRHQEPNGWLEVFNWFQQSMVPAGTVPSHADLDLLDTKRPIVVHNSFGHTSLANARALALASITAATPDPANGLIARDATGAPTGILEDSAQHLLDTLLPEPTDADRLAAARVSLDAMRKEGITTFLDASADAQTIAAYATVQREGKLTARAHFAVEIEPEAAKEPDKAVAAVVEIARRFDQGPVAERPTITVRNAKLYMDGVITAPAFTGVMLEPYLENRGTAQNPQWVPSGNRGPAPYFAADVLKALLLKLAAAGIDPHIHADGDGATRYALDGFEAMRAVFPGAPGTPGAAGQAIRAAIAHVEIVDPTDFPRFGKLDVIPVPSFQWAKPAGDTIEGARDYLGPRRFRYMEPLGFLHEAGARIAYGSDWPVDPLDEWFGLKVGVTRTNALAAGPQYAGRLGDDPGLSRATVIRAITANASYALHQEKETGSLEVGKFADLIVLDRDPFTIPAEEIAEVDVLLTVVGGEVVHGSAALADRTAD